MAETDLLEGLLELFQENVENVDFRRAYDPGWGTRLLVRPVVCGQVAAQRLQDGRQETELVFWIFAPEESQREQVLSALWSLLREQCPGCGELTRETGRTDNLTRHRCAVLRALFSGEEGLSLQGREILLGGKAYRAAGISVSLSLSGEELVSVGEGRALCPAGPGGPIPGGAGGASKRLWFGENGGVYRADWKGALYGVPVETVGAYSREGGLPCHKPGRNGGDAMREERSETSRDRAEEVSRQVERDSRRYPASL